MPLVRDAVAARAAFRSFAKTRESRGTDISFITGIRLVQRGIQVDKSASFCIGHPLLERFRDPRIFVLHDEFGDLRPLAGWKGFKLLDNFSGAHDDQDTLPSYSPQNRCSFVSSLSTLNNRQSASHHKLLTLGFLESN